MSYMHRHTQAHWMQKTTFWIQLNEAKASEKYIAICYNGLHITCKEPAFMKSTLLLNMVC